MITIILISKTKQKDILQWKNILKTLYNENWKKKKKWFIILIFKKPALCDNLICNFLPFSSMHYLGPISIHNIKG